MPSAAPNSASLIVPEYQVTSGTLQPALISPASLSDSPRSDRPSPKRLTSREQIRRDNEDCRPGWAVTDASDMLGDRERKEWPERKVEQEGER